MRRFFPLFCLSWLMLLGLPVTSRAAADDSGPGLGERARQLAADVREFATQPGFSRAKRERRIATAVRTAVVAATAYRDDTDGTLAAANRLAGAAVQAAPAFTEVIVNAVAYAPPVVRAGGSVVQIRTAALAQPPIGRAAKVARKKSSASVRAHPRALPPSRADAEDASEDTPGDSSERSLPAARRAVMRDESTDDEDERGFTRQDRGRFTGDQRAGFTVSAQVGATHDDNIFRSETNKVGDTIVSVTPGLNARWGSDALLHGSLNLSESFRRYSGRTSPNVNLASGALQVGYDSGSEVSAALGTNFNQLNQTNADILSSGQSQLVRTDVVGANGNISLPIGAKTGVRLGTDYNRLDYKSAVLIGNTTLRLPLDLYYRVTPKTSLSLGYAYSTQRPDKGGADSKDNYFNLGASGEFTPKLSGNVSAGVQTRRVGANPSERVFAFNGNLNYALTPKLAATLALNRNFNISAIGATTTNTSYRVGLAADLSPQWQLNANIARLDNNYGDTVFRVGGLLGSGVLRRDHTWEAGFLARYLVNSWLATTASYSLSRNTSTLAGLNYQSNLFSLLFDLSY